MNIIKTKQLQKGFTLIEVLLVIVLIGILIAIGLVSFNTEARFIDARNDIRKTHIQTLESAITQYKLQEGNYPTGLSRNYQEICDPEATVCTGFFDLKQFLVPNYLQAIPQDPNDTDTTGGAGYSVAVDEATNTVSVRALQAEGGVIINTNDPLPTEPTTVSNTPLAATVPVTPPPPIVTNGLVLHLDAGDTASYPGTGTTWFDLSGNGNNGTLINGVGYNSTNGGSLVFDGSNDYVTIPFKSDFAFGTGDFTIEFWMLMTSVTNNYQLLGGTHLGGYGGSGWYYYARNNLQSNGAGRHSFGYISDVQNTQAAIQPNTWIQMIARRTSGTLTFFQNTSQGASASFTDNIINGSPLIIGNLGGIGFPTTYAFSGNISIVRIYKGKGLTSEEIQQNFNVTRGRFGL